MPTLNFESVLNTLKNGIAKIAKTDLNNYLDQATQDGQSIITKLKDDLENWTKQVTTGALSATDLSDLVMGQKDELEMVALKQAGLGEIAVDQFKSDVFNLITNTLTSLIP